MDPVEPGRPSVLDVNEREKYIVRANDPLQGGDLGRAVVRSLTKVLIDVHLALWGDLLRGQLGVALAGSKVVLVSSNQSCTLWIVIVLKSDNSLRRLRW